VSQQSKHLRHVQRGKALTSLNDRLCQTPLYADIAIEPIDRFRSFTAMAKINAPEQNAEACCSTKNGQITNDPLAILMRG
jgi:hypothetical protein